MYFPSHDQIYIKILLYLAAKSLFFKLKIHITNIVGWRTHNNIITLFFSNTQNDHLFIIHVRI